MFEDTSLSRLDKIHHPLFEEHGVQVYIKRDDLLHEHVSGNKWRKLKYNLKHARSRNLSNILTFGGAYSNHIVATAAACKMYGFNSIGIIRGDELHANANDTLIKASEFGMKLKFITREEYRRRSDVDFLESLSKKYQSTFVIPEGGSNALAVRGCGELIDEIDVDFDHIICAVGTGGTMAGIVSRLEPDKMALGIPVLKNAHYLEAEVKKLVKANHYKINDNWQLFYDYHMGGYAKFNVHLIEFINQFKVDQDVQLDPVYTGKMMFALFDMIKRSRFRSGSKIIAIHTGGLQGIDGFNKTQGNLIKV